MILTGAILHLDRRNRPSRRLTLIALVPRGRGLSGCPTGGSQTPERDVRAGETQHTFGLEMFGSMAV